MKSRDIQYLFLKIRMTLNIHHGFTLVRLVFTILPFLRCSEKAFC